MTASCREHASSQPSQPNRSGIRDSGRRSATDPLRTRLFLMGDALFLVVVGIVSTVTMHRMHQLGWGFAITCIVGMCAAMAAQMLLAWCVAPLLGSIEAMTPSMVVGMISPMSVCTLHMLGHEPHAATAATLGSLSGLAVFVFVVVYARSCTRKLRVNP